MTRIIRGDKMGRVSNRRVYTWVFVLCGLAVLGGGFALAPRCYWAHRTNKALGRITFDGRAVLLDGMRPAGSEGVFCFNTFDDELLTNGQIGRVFDQVTAELSATLHAPPVLQVRTDVEGWEKLCGVWQTPEGYAELGAGSANDNNYVYLQVGLGRPPVREIEDLAKRRPGSRVELKKIFIR